ncbi:ABC transporter ATP-binding protein [Oceanithermus sp.]
MSVIRVANLTKIYRRPARSNTGWLKDLFGRRVEEVIGVNDISFSVDPGEFIGYVGLNGAGKTTTMKILAGILHPTSGEVGVLEHVPWKREPAFLRRIGFVMGQKQQLWWDLPAADTFEFLRTIYDIPRQKFTKSIGEMSEILDVAELIQTPVRNLSLGERAKVELIASLLHDPEVVFLDEPTLGMDVLAQRNMRSFFAEYNRRYHKTMLLTTHNLSDVEALCQRVIVIHQGRIIWDGDLDDLLSRYDRERVFRIVYEASGRLQEEKIEASKAEATRLLGEFSAKGRVVTFEEERLNLERVVARMLESAS